MRKFIISNESIKDNMIVFSPADTYHLAVVLRKKPGDTLECLDQRGTFYSCVLKDLSDDAARAEILMRTYEEAKRSSTPMVLIMPLLKKRNTELILQKGTEMGVECFAPLVFKRSVVIPEAEKKQARFEKIIHEACKQCGRAQPPELLGISTSLAELCDKKPGIGDDSKISIFAWEHEKRVHIKELLRGPQAKPEEVFLAIGPEGGISEDEVEQFRSRGFLSGGMGPLILRAETAALYGIAVCKYEFF